MDLEAEKGYMTQLLAFIEQRHSTAHKVRHQGVLVGPLSCSIGPSIAWNTATIEQQLAIRIPPDIVGLWNQASFLRLFEDTRDGQWGLIIWTPEQVLAEQAARLEAYDPLGRDFRKGDVLLGEFLGDCDLLLIRCDPEQSDFGEVIVVLALDNRAVWPRVGKSFAGFVERFISSAGEKFWDVSSLQTAPLPTGVIGEPQPPGPRAQWGKPQREAYIAEWGQRGYPEPAQGWRAYDLALNRPREFGGTNVFDNVVPIIRRQHWAELNSWWKAFVV
jgi:hypothetical protein